MQTLGTSDAATTTGTGARARALAVPAAGAACVALMVALVSAACAKKQDDSQPAAAPTATAGYPGYPAQGAYPQPYPGQYPAPSATYASPYPTAPGPAPGAPTAAPMPTAPAPAGSGQMAVPGPLALQCTNDVPCGTHHCNLAYSKCAFPCQSAADCITPAQCLAGLCIFPLIPPH